MIWTGQRIRTAREILKDGAIYNGKKWMNTS